MKVVAPLEWAIVEEAKDDDSLTDSNRVVKLDNDTVRVTSDVTGKIDGEDVAYTSDLRLSVADGEITGIIAESGGDVMRVFQSPRVASQVEELMKLFNDKRDSW